MKKSLFWKIYRISIFVLALIILNVWGILYLFLDTYEKNIPENLVSSIIDTLNSKEYKVIDKSIDSEEFYSTKDLVNIMKNNSKDENYSFKKVNGLTDENELSYKILSGDKEVARLTLEKSKDKAMFNVEKWQVKNTVVNSVEKHTIKVIVPTEAEVSINGVKVKDDYITAASTTREKFDAIKNQISVPAEKIYEVKDIYDGTEIKAKYNGKDYTLVESDKEYYFTYPSNDSMLNEAKGNLDAFVENYTRYIIAERGFGSVTPYLVRNSSAYNFLAKIAMTNLWSGDHNAAIIKDIKYANMQEYSNDLFSVDVDYTYEYDVFGGSHKTFAPHVTLYLMRTASGWLIVDLAM